MHERSTEQKNKYFRKVTLNIQREGLDVLPEKDGLLPVEQDGRPLCLILDSGSVRYWEKDVDSGYPITDERQKQLKSAAEQIERGVPDLAERVSLSLHAEEELNDRILREQEGMRF